MAEISPPQDTTGMTTRDDTVYCDRNAARGSIASKTDAEILADANSVAHSGEDPISRRVTQDENIPGFYTKPRPIPGTLTGTADPIFAKAGLAIGDRVYHKKQRSEGVVKDMLASGKIIVHLDNGVKGKTDPNNLVKL